jgi:hypothetical protein
VKHQLKSLMPESRPDLSANLSRISLYPSIASVNR